MPNFKWSIVLLILLVAPWLPAQQKIVIVFAETGYPPYYSADLTQGLLIEFLKGFSQAHREYSLVYKSVPRRRMIQMMQTGEAQAFSLTSPFFEPPGPFVYSDSLWKETSRVFIPADDPRKLTTLEQLEGMTLGGISGNIYPRLEEQFRQGRVKLHQVTTSLQLFRLLDAGRIDGFLGDERVTLFRMTQEGFSGAFKPSELSLGEFGLCLQVQKDRQDFLWAVNDLIRKR